MKTRSMLGQASSNQRAAAIGVSSDIDMEPRSGAIGSGGTSPPAAANVDHSHAKFSNEVSGTGVTSPAGSSGVDEDTRPTTEEVLEFTRGTYLEESLLADKEDLDKLQHANMKLRDAYKTSLDIIFHLIERANLRADDIRKGAEAQRKVESLQAELKQVKEKAADDAFRAKEEAADQLVKAMQEADQLLRQKEADLEAEKTTLEAKGYLEDVIKGSNETEKKLAQPLLDMLTGNPRDRM